MLKTLARRLFKTRPQTTSLTPPRSLQAAEVRAVAGGPLIRNRAS